MIILSLLIKSSQEPEIKGFYSSFIFHPFANHYFTHGKNSKGYISCKELIDIKSIHNDFLLSKDNDQIAIIKIQSGIVLNRLDRTEIENFLRNWENILATVSEIKNIKSYFFSEKNYGDMIQLFIEIDSYKMPLLNDIQSDCANYQYYQKADSDYLQVKSSEDKFIPETNFYMIIRQKNQRNNIHPVIKSLIAFYNKYFNQNKKASLEKEHQVLLEENYLLKEKIKNLQEFFQNNNIQSSQLELVDLQNFTENWLGKDYFNNEVDETITLIDRAKYLEHKSTKDSPTITKTYRMIFSPESGDLDFWIYDFIKNAACKSIISIQLLSRNALKDRLKLEQKSIYSKQLSNLSRQSTLAIIKETEIASQKLLEKAISFDISIFITIFCKDLNELQKIDNSILSPIRYSKISGLDRQQVPNYYYSLPFAYNELNDKEMHFACLDFAKASFPFIRSQIGSEKGFVAGFDHKSQKVIFVDDYNRSEFHNRNFNFIGDSGSGKTVLAKILLLRMFVEQDRFFYIVDSTEDGWSFFTHYLGGKIIEIDKINLNEGESLFAPFEFTSSQRYNLNQHIDDLINFLKLLKSPDKELQTTEKTFLIQSLKELYAQYAKPCFSDLYKLWNSYIESHSSALSKEWLEIISPYCYISNGIYASLADGRELKINDRLVLFTFSKITSDESFIRASLFLVVNFISKKIVFFKQAKTNLIIDEAWKLFGSNKSVYAKDLLTHLARAGRGLDLGLWTISQKPCDLPAEVHSNSSCSFVFQLKEFKDRFEIARFSNLTEKETEIINSGLLNNAGTVFMKSTRSSGLMNISLNPLENILTNSTREFANRRNQLFESFKQNQSGKLAALSTSLELLRTSIHG